MMIPYLEGFSKRMELTSCIASILQRKGKSTSIEVLFETNELDNIIFSVLIHIMERSLTEGSKCTLDDIEDFIAKILPLYQKNIHGNELHTLTQYIVKDILLNSSTVDPFEYHYMDYTTGKMMVHRIRLISDMVDDDNIVCYYLTPQGFDMLFRSKEVDEALGFELEEIRLEKLIQRGNYKDATSQSYTLIRMLNEKSTELDLFEKQLHNDVHSTSGEEYEHLIKSVSDTLNSEHDTMKSIKETIGKAFEHISASTRKSEETAAAKVELYRIEENVDTILLKQRELLVKARNLRNIYLKIIDETLSVKKSKTFDIEKVLLQPLETFDRNNVNTIDTIISSLLAPLCIPSLPHTLRIGMFYDPQKIREELVGDEITQDEEFMDNSIAQNRSLRRIHSHTELVRILFEFASQNTHFTLSDLWNYILENSDLFTIYSPYMKQESLIFISGEMKVAIDTVMIFMMNSISQKK